MYKNSLNTDRSVQNAIDVPNVPEVTKNDHSVPIKKLLGVPTKRLPTHLVYQQVYQT